jgi:hypothetical protein
MRRPRGAVEDEPSTARCGPPAHVEVRGCRHREFEEGGGGCCRRMWGRSPAQSEVVGVRGRVFLPKVTAIYIAVTVLTAVDR